MFPECCHLGCANRGWGPGCVEDAWNHATSFRNARRPLGWSGFTALCVKNRIANIMVAVAQGIWVESVSWSHSVIILILLIIFPSHALMLKSGIFAQLLPNNVYHSTVSAFIKLHRKVMLQFAFCFSWAFGFVATLLQPIKPQCINSACCYCSAVESIITSATCCDGAVCCKITFNRMLHAVWSTLILHQTVPPSQQPRIAHLHARLAQPWSQCYDQCMTL